LDKVFIENSEYRPYFYDDKPLPQGDDEHSKQERDKIFSLADMKLDVMETYYSQTDHIKLVTIHEGGLGRVS
jgi:hypothetical protein